GSGLSKQVKLDDPDLVGLSAERTVWTASLPKRWTIDDTLRDTFGNMEPIAEEGRQIEKLQSWMSDLSRLNRVMRSSNDGYLNDKALKEADKLNKQIEEVTQQVESKSKSRYSYDEYATKSESKQAEKYASKLDGDLSKVKEELSKQVTVLNENRIAQPVFNSNKVASIAANGWSANLTASAPAKPANTASDLNGRYAEYQGLVGDVQEKAKELARLTGDAQTQGRIELNSKMQKAKQLELQLGDREQILSQTTGLNDNVAVNNNFFKADAGTLTLTGSNTFTGSTTVNGGTLSTGGQMTISGSVITSGAISIMAGSGSMFQGVASNSSISNFSQSSIAGTVATNNLNAFGATSNARAYNNNGGLNSLPQIADNISVGTVGRDVLGGVADPFAAKGLRSDSGAISLKGVGGITSSKPAPETADALIAEGADRARKQLGAGAPAARLSLPAPAAPPPPPGQLMGGWADGVANRAAIEGLKAAAADDNRNPTTQAVNQLRPTGRHSLQVEVPSSGETWHFRKLKDHAVLDLPLKQEWAEGKTTQATVFGLGLGAWGFLAFFTARRRKRA
ncbi:MAG: hypothetical protein JWO89_3224, partial [Verrucomicrobiaceae bacterium]|nr:hypothetical protein [Verrucomicrobiaceae bacterium]